MSDKTDKLLDNLHPLDRITYNLITESRPWKEYNLKDQENITKFYHEHPQIAKALRSDKSSYDGESAATKSLSQYSTLPASRYNVPPNKLWSSYHKTKDL